MEGQPPTPPRPEQEGFGSATPGEAQSSDPPKDPEMIRDEEGPEEEEPSEKDPDSGPTETASQVDQDSERDQAEG